MYIYIYIYMYTHTQIYIYICVLGGRPKRGVSKRTVCFVLNFPYMKICLLVWDSGLHTMIT